MTEKTLRELKNEVSSLEQNKDKPKAAELRALPVHIEKILTDSSLSFYENGFCLYIANGRHTVFHLDDCNNYSFTFVTNTENLSYEYFQDQEWFVLPVLIGENLLVRNQEHRLSNHGVFSYSSIAEDYEDMKDPDHFLETLMLQETVQEIFSLWDDRQTTALRAYYLEGHSQKQISEELHIPQQNVSYLLKSTLKKIQKHFGCEGNSSTRIRNNNISLYHARK